MESKSVKELEITVQETEETIIIDPSASFESFLIDIAPVTESSPRSLPKNYKIQYVTNSEKMASIINNATY